jgi:glucose-6-phosphate dehydrogenase assembly protein OpcA
MADAGSSTAFLSGQGIPVPLGEVEAELARLWGPSAERAGGPEVEGPSVTRVALANLVVAGLGPDAARVEPVLDTVVMRRPCRAIVLADGGGPPRRVGAEVSALCHLPAPGRPQVCSERIVLRAGPGALDLLPGAVFALLEPDLPMVLWWVGDPGPGSGLCRTLAAEAARLVPDLPDPCGDAEAVRAALGPGAHPFGRDLAWFGVGRWRELVAQFFDGAEAAEALGRVARVEIDAEMAEGSDAAAIPRAPAWLAAWLAGQLGWRPIRREAGEGGVAATFARADGSGEVSVRIRVGRAPGLDAARVTRVRLGMDGPRGEESFALARSASHPEEVRIEACAPCRCALPRLVRAPELDAAGRVSAALESSRDDPPYRAARGAMFWLLGLG